MKKKRKEKKVGGERGMGRGERGHHNFTVCRNQARTGVYSSNV